MRSSRLFIAALLLAALARVCDAGEFYDGTAVIELDSVNFDAIVSREDSVTLVEFYAPWCGHCKSLKPHWIKAAAKLSGVVQVAALDCDKASNKGLAAKYGIKGFPTIKMFKGPASSSGKKRPKARKPVDYNGERTAKAIVRWAKENVPSAVRTVTSKSEGKFNDDRPHLPRALFFMKKKKVPTLYKALSTKFKEYMPFGVVLPSEKKLARKYYVDDRPLLMVVPPHGVPPVFYEGEFKPRALKKFFRKFIIDDEGRPLLADEPGDYLPEITDESCMQAHCASKGGICVLLVTDQTHSRLGDMDTLIDVKEKQTNALFNFAWIDVDKHGEWLEDTFDVHREDFSQLVAFSYSKKRYAPFVGSFKQDNIRHFLDSVLRGGTKTVPIESKKLAELKGPAEGERGACQDLLDKKDKKKSKSKSKSKSKGKSKQAKGKAKNEHATPETVTADTSFLEARGSVPLNEELFEKLVMKSTSPWMVEFYAPWCGHCKKLAPEWTKAARKTKGMVRFAQIDATQEQGLAARFGIQGYPTIKYFPGGDKTDKDAADYVGQRSAKALVRHAFGLLKEDLVEMVTDHTFVQWFKQQPDLPRAVLFTEKDEVAPLMKALSMEFERRMLFAIVHRSQEGLVQRFNVQKFPTIVSLEPPMNHNPETGQVNVAIYGGKLNFYGIGEFLAKLATVRKEPGAAGVAADEAFPTVVRVSDQDTFEQACAKKMGLCLIGLGTTETMWQEEDEQEYHAVLLQAASQLRARNVPVHFVVVNRDKQPEFAAAWSIHNDEPMQVVVTNVRKKRYAVHVGVFDAEHLVKFVESVLAGRIKTAKLRQELPAIVDEQPPKNDAAQDEQPVADHDSDDEEDGEELEVHDEL